MESEYTYAVLYDSYIECIGWLEGMSSMIVILLFLEMLRDRYDISKKWE